MMGNNMMGFTIFRRRRRQMQRKEEELQASAQAEETRKAREHGRATWQGEAFFWGGCRTF